MGAGATGALDQEALRHWPPGASAAEARGGCCIQGSGDRAGGDGSIASAEAAARLCGVKNNRPAPIMTLAIPDASMTTALLLALAGSLVLMTVIVQRLSKASN